jgi:amidase
MEAGKLTSHSLTSPVPARASDHRQIRAAPDSVIEINPEALKIALDMDRERNLKRARPAARHPRSTEGQYRHGRPHEHHGRFAGAGRRARRAQRPCAAQLRAAGAVIIGKTNLSEWAEYALHPFRQRLERAWRPDLESVFAGPQCSGSSSGSGAAIAAGLATLAVGTETDGSIVSPASICGLVGIKPTLGLVSRSGIIPIAHSQDTAGPMARSVADAALMLTPWWCRSADPVTQEGAGKLADYSAALDKGGLKARA